MRKRNEKKEDKLIFKWKLITLGLSILFIVLVGAFSQILKAVNNLPDVGNDKSFIVPLLQQAVSTPALSTVQQANLLIKGITAGMDSYGQGYSWNRASLIYDYSSLQGNIDLTVLTQKMTSRGDLVIIVSNQVATPNRFAFFARHAYSESSGIANVYDDSSKHTSS